MRGLDPREDAQSPQTELQGTEAQSTIALRRS